MQLNGAYGHRPVETSKALESREEKVASGAPHQMERGKSAMMTALAGIVLALVAYGVVELVMNAVVDPGIDIDDVLPEPEAPDAGGDG